jgi:hypothetical protein
VAQAELRALTAELLKYREELTAAQRVEFDGEHSDINGNFFFIDALLLQLSGVWILADSFCLQMPTMMNPSWPPSGRD